MRQCEDCGRLHLDVDCEICALKKARNGLHQDTLTKGSDSLEHLKRFSPIGLQFSTSKALAHALFQMFENTDGQDLCDRTGMPMLDFIVGFLVKTDAIDKAHSQHVKNVYDLWHYAYGGVIESL